MIKSDYRVKPGSRLKLSRCAAEDTGHFKDKDDAQSETEKNRARLMTLQEVLYAEGKHALLIVFQAMDGGGKDGAIEHVFSGVNPQGCTVTGFRVPTPLEKAHDFLWRIHQATPAKGMIGIFNRSHYESVIVERVKKLTPKAIWAKRYDQINVFEEMLAREGTTILKFFLHISKDEQKRRLQARIDDKDKNWKFNPADLGERARWNAYQEAFNDAINRCSTAHAPWYVVPADRKWFRNWVVSETIVKTLERLKMKFPAPPPGLDKIVVK